jgi:hypothetical protein
MISSMIKRILNNRRRLLIIVIFVGGLPFSAVKEAESIGFGSPRGPPTYASEVIEKNYKIGWKFILKAQDECKTKYGKPWLYTDAAINYFKNAYEKDQKLESLYLWAYSVYDRANYEPTFEETEKRVMEALELVEKRLKEVPNDFDFIDLKEAILRNLAEMYYDAYNHDPYYREDIDESKLDIYKQKSIEYGNKWLEFYKDISERWDKIDKYLFKELNYTKDNVESVKKDFKEAYIGDEKFIKKILNEMTVR